MEAFLLRRVCLPFDSTTPRSTTHAFKRYGRRIRPRGRYSIRFWAQLIRSLGTPPGYTGLMVRYYGWLLGAACLFVSALAQTGTQEPVLRITVNLIQVDAVVTDAGGHQVTNLKADDFEILEDGRPQKITGFSYVNVGVPRQEHIKATPTPKSVASPIAPPPTSVNLAKQQVQRTIVLMVDDIGLSFESAARVRNALRKFVDEHMQESDLVAVIRTRAGMGSLQQFTNDKRFLYTAIERVRGYPSGPTVAGAFAPLGSEPLSNAAQMRMGGRGNGEERNLDQGRRANFLVGTLGAITFVIRALRELPGRKALILFSDGMVTGDAPGGLSNLIDQANRAAVLIYTVDARALQCLCLTALDNTLDPKYNNPRVLAGVLQDRVDRFKASQAGLDYLARQTGGFLVHDTNDLNWGIDRVLDDLSGYYLIGYKPDESSFEPESGRRIFHQIHVRVKLRGLQVRSRTGYLGVPDGQSRPVSNGKTEQMAAALSSPFNSSDIKVGLTCLFAEEPNNGAAIRTLLHVDAHDLKFTEDPDGVRNLSLDVAALVFDEQGVVVGQSGRAYTIRLPQREYEEGLSRGFVYKLNVAISKPGGYQMRVAVRDAASNKVGSASHFVEVPDLRHHRLALSGILLHGALPPGAEGSVSKEYDIASPATPAVRVFRSGEVVSLGYVIFDARRDRETDRPEIETQFLLYRERLCVFTSPVIPFRTKQQDDLGRLSATGSLRLGSNLEPGEYVLQVVAWDKLAPAKFRVASQWIDLELVP
jgi:VWFA-related protein